MTLSWVLGPDSLDQAPEVPVVRWSYELCAAPGPGHLRCDRPTGHGGRCYESIWDGDEHGEIRFVIGAWWA